MQTEYVTGVVEREPQVANPDSGADEAAPSVPNRVELKPVFTGSGREYFRIWIVNVFLTVLTLGIYAAWAKVRTRRYFHVHTSLGGHIFDYLADPMVILRGNLIVGVGFAVYTLGEFFNPYLAGGVALIAWVIWPLLVHKSLRFRARNTSHRGLRFRFNGNLREAYLVFSLYPLLIPLTLGLVYPYWAYRRSYYFFNNMGFGRNMAYFDGKAKSFYRYYTAAGVIAIVFIVTFSLYMSGFVMNLARNQGQLDNWLLELSIYGISVMGFLIFTVLDQYIKARTFNLCWNNTHLGAVEFSAKLEATKLTWIRITNILGIVLTLGIYFPWAKVRRTRYLMESFTIAAKGDLNRFTSFQDQEDSAIGDTAVDFFDFEVGF